MLYTRKGDNGTSGLFNTKERFPKDSPVYEALGMLDELNSLLGFCRAQLTNENSGDVDIISEILKVQQYLFIIQAEIAGSEKILSQTYIDELEETIDNVETLLIELPHAFTIPGTTVVSGLFDYARAVCRRTERMMVTVSRKRKMSPQALAYINRLSSLLYIFARYTAAIDGSKELSPHY